MPAPLLHKQALARGCSQEGFERMRVDGAPTFVKPVLRSGTPLRGNRVK